MRRFIGREPSRTMGFARGASCGNVPDGKTAVTSSCQQLPNPRLGNRRRRCHADHFCV